MTQFNASYSDIITAKQLTHKTKLTPEYAQSLKKYLDDILANIHQIIDAQAAGSLAEGIGNSLLVRQITETLRKTIDAEACLLLNTAEVVTFHSEQAVRGMESAQKRFEQLSQMVKVDASAVEAATKTADKHVASLRKLNDELDRLQAHVDSGILVVASACHSAAKSVDGRKKATKP